MKLVNDARGNVFEHSLGGSQVPDDVKARVRKQMAEQKMKSTVRGLATWGALLACLALVVIGLLYV